MPFSYSESNLSQILLGEIPRYLLVLFLSVLSEDKAIVAVPGCVLSLDNDHMLVQGHVDVLTHTSSTSSLLGLGCVMVSPRKDLRAEQGIP